MDATPLTHSAVATLKTSLAPTRYLGQLCKHFEHKIPATYDDGFHTGRIEFSSGTCELSADETSGELVMTARAANETDLARVEDVVARHLVRFAFRETLEITWTPAVPA